jgi:N-acetylglucosaminyldiphosphoundecaprenol N-acetyl-beta-D-mannosaminyltransferase
MTAISRITPGWRPRVRSGQMVRGDAPAHSMDPALAHCAGRGPQVRIGRLWIDAVTFQQTLDAIEALVEAGQGGAVYTPNVDHVITAESNGDFRRAYRAADLVLADGAPIVWASRVLGTPLPAKVSGSDLILPLARLAGQRQWRVYLLGGEPGVAALAAERLRSRYRVNIVGIDDAIVRLDAGELERRTIADRITDAKTELLFVALGAPKQELWINQVRDSLGPVVAIGVGASLDFVAGKVRRAPRWMSSVGLEWVFRLAQEPRRLWRRYLLRGPRFISIVFRSGRLRRTQRIRPQRESRGPEAIGEQ